MELNLNENLKPLFSTNKNPYYFLFFTNDSLDKQKLIVKLADSFVNITWHKGSFSLFLHCNVDNQHVNQFLHRSVFKGKQNHKCFIKEKYCFWMGLFKCSWIAQTKYKWSQAFQQVAMFCYSVTLTSFMLSYHCF